MTITLSPETQQLLEERMKRDGFKSADDAVRALLEDDFEMDRDPETMAAIAEGMADAEAGRSRPWAEFEKEWMADDQQK